MNPKILKNLPHLVVLIRTAFVFIIISLFCLDSWQAKVVGLFLILFIAALDGFDGYLARRLKVSSKVGGLIDTLGDRITENVLLMFFAYNRLIPLAVSVVFVTRSFLSDFIRYQAHQFVSDTFSINKSKLGYIFVASNASRALYLTLKIIIFFLGGAILTLESVAFSNYVGLGGLLINLKIVIWIGSIVLVLFNLLRFALLIYDSREILKKAFS